MNMKLQKKVPKIDDHNGCTTISMCLMPLNYTLKMAKMVILLCLFVTNKIFKVQRNEKLSLDYIMFSQVGAQIV